MAVFKCKMCGGDLNVQEGVSVCECEYCGTKQTIPAADNEKKINLFNRANHLRSSCEFDKAAGVYESIVSEFPEEAEAYWGLCLCKFGIEYVDDPATGKKIPTCHRTSYDSIFEDNNFEQSLEWSDSVAHSVYRAEAKEIDRLQKEILNIAQNEEPFDVFICYKESDENGQRTDDSELAHDIYDVLTEKGYKVFYARITLKSKLGQDYEPYIFSALNSAKVMLAIGTKYEYYNAVWVKNEWSRFLALMSSDNGKMLIPCYRNIDAYDMPKEFRHLQGQDLSSPRAFQDLVNSIERIIPLKGTDKPAVPAQPISSVPTVDSLTKRATIFLEDGEFEKAYEYAEKALDANPENGYAYLIKLCIAYKVNKPEELAGLKTEIESDTNYKKAMSFGDDNLKSKLKEYSLTIVTRIKREKEEEEARIEQERKDRIAYEQLAKEKRLSIKHNRIARHCDSFSVILPDGSFSFGKTTWTNVIEVSNGTKFIAGLKFDGSVVINVDYDVNQDMKDALSSISYSNDIIAISSGGMHLAGLKADGTVVVVGSNEYGQCNTSEWRDIVAVSATDYHTIGLKEDGTVVAAGSYENDQFNTSDWRDIVAVSANVFNIIGLKKDGTVVAAGRNKEGQCNTSGWRDIVAVSVGGWHTIGLKKDGTVVAVGSNTFGECNTSDWKNIVAVSASSGHTVGLKNDGTVVAVGKNDCMQCDLSEWRNIIDIAAFESRTIGFLSPCSIIDSNVKYYRVSHNVCRYCGGEFTGLLKKCSICGKRKDY